LEGGGEAGDVGLGALEELEGFVLQRAVGIEFRIRLNIGDDGNRVVAALMIAGEKDVDVGLFGIAQRAREQNRRS